MSEPEQPTVDSSQSTVSEKAQKAIERGDFAEAKRLARKAVDSGDEKEREAGRGILARMKPDPVVIALAIGCALLFGLVLLFWVRA